jgi:hypothetical protein
LMATFQFKSWLPTSILCYDPNRANNQAVNGSRR